MGQVKKLVNSLTRLCFLPFECILSFPPERGFESEVDDNADKTSDFLLRVFATLPPLGVDDDDETSLTPSTLVVEEEDEDVNFLEGLAASPSPFPLPPPPPSAKVPTLSIDTEFFELEIEESCCLLPRPAVCIATLPVDNEEGAATA